MRPGSHSVTSSGLCCHSSVGIGWGVCSGSAEGIQHKQHTLMPMGGIVAGLRALDGPGWSRMVRTLIGPRCCKGKVEDAISDDYYPSYSSSTVVKVFRKRRQYSKSLVAGN
ncbi:hypothetical protein I7I50_08214 [Histoplasma capsulatum G186AR]|uniref:Uncharacterized protein n=1 Tax=Ajellomyces capsulatus TaxID=5037 RepID=A0A8H7YTJ6_AJECA|nr:hypothetical protein I7I52_05731 [Histoplasma capsulatum]QSS73436.1 hypothetical protein I7I50_08214 [Histoplasma capsulatum G186AR]